MSLLEVKFDVSGEAQYVRAFEILEHEAHDLSEPMRQTGERLLEWVGEQFATEGARMGDPWAPLSPDYAAWKEANFPGNPLLVRTGDMLGAATSPEAVSSDSHSMTYEVHSDYAIYHQTGTSTPMPQRKIVDLTTEMRRAWDRVFAEWLNSIRTGPISPARS